MQQFIKPTHTYQAMVNDIRNPKAKTAVAAMNGKRCECATNRATNIPGWAIINFQNAVIERAIMGTDEETGMPEIKGWEKTPRYAVTTYNDLTEKKECFLPPIPQGGVELKTAEEASKSLDQKSRDELREIAKTLGVAGYTAMNKAELVKNIQLLQS